MQMTGAEVMVKCLAEQGVTTVFGYPGGAILPFYDALREAADIRHILTAHEQGAAHAADGYARAGGQVGVCIATSGPGATNLVTGLANAFLDSIPVVAITGQVPVAMIGRDAFQEVDIVGMHHGVVERFRGGDVFVSRYGKPMPIFRRPFIVRNGVWENRLRICYIFVKSGDGGKGLDRATGRVKTLSRAVKQRCAFVV